MSVETHKNLKWFASITLHTHRTNPTWHRRSQGHKHHSRHRVLQSYRAAEVWCQVAGDRCEDTDKRYGDNEAGPAVPVLRGRDEGEQNFPEDGEEVHDVVEAGRQPLLAALLFIVVSFWVQRVREERGERALKEGQKRKVDKSERTKTSVREGEVKEGREKWKY